MNKKNPKVGIIWANLDSPNLGVAALAYSSIVIFEEIAKRKNLTFDYILWGSKTQTHVIKVASRDIYINEKKYFLGGDLKRYIKNFLRRPWVYFNYRHILSLKKCDILADTGEGDSYADIYGIERFRNFNYIKTACLKANKPYILLPQTIGPFSSKEAQTKAKKNLHQAAAVIARDNQSYEYCRQIAPKTRLWKSIDMAFFLPYNDITIDKAEDKINVGINISGLLWHGGYTGNNQFGLKDNYSDAILKLLDLLENYDNLQVHLVGHVISDTPSYDEDSHILLELNKRYPEFKLAPSFKSPIEAKSYIANMDFFTGARMHACIAAISSGVPVIPMAYSRKFNGLFMDTLMYNCMIDLKTDDAEKIVDKFINALENRESLKDKIKEINHNIISPQKEAMIELISSFIEK